MSTSCLHEHVRDESAHKGQNFTRAHANSFSGDAAVAGDAAPGVAAWRGCRLFGQLAQPGPLRAEHGMAQSRKRCTARVSNDTRTVPAPKESCRRDDEPMTSP